jgi:predicted nuclease of predicted toxin-antitoxin system
VKLLLDQNLSPRLVMLLANAYPGSVHVQSVGLDRDSDEAVWAYARTHGFTIVSKDEDFSEMVILRGFPPKVIWLQLGNCTTEQVGTALRALCEDIKGFGADLAVGIFVVT